MVQGAVEQQGGRILIDSGPGGTCFALQFVAAPTTSLRAEAPFGAMTLNLATHVGADLWLSEPRWSADRPGPAALVRDFLLKLARNPMIVGIVAGLAFRLSGLALPGSDTAKLHGAFAKRAATIGLDLHYR